MEKAVDVREPLALTASPRQIASIIQEFLGSSFNREPAADRFRLLSCRRPSTEPGGPLGWSWSRNTMLTVSALWFAGPHSENTREPRQRDGTGKPRRYAGARTSQ